MNEDEDDVIAEIERIDRFFDGEEDGEIPMTVLRARGMEVPPAADLDDDALHAKLWEVIRAMAGIGMYLEDTDHLADRELYAYLVGDVLLEATVLPIGDGGGWFISPIGGCSEEDNEIYLRYYADEETRRRWARDFRETIPPKEKPPYDRDRLLPQKDFAARRSGEPS